MSRFKAVLFDFNGVIVDDEPVHFRLFQEVCREEGISLSKKDYYTRYLGFDDKGAFTTIFADHGPDLLPHKLQELIDRKAAKYEKNIENNIITFPGVIELVNRLHNNLRLAIVSGALRQEIVIVTKRMGIADHFDTIVSANDTRFGKPHPEGYLKALENLQALVYPISLFAEDCLVIEDSLAGIDSAHGAGMKCLAVTNSYSPEELAKADWVVSSLEGLSIDELK